jgi:hypothetical protein
MLLERRIPEEAHAWSHAQERLTSGRCAERESGESEATSQNAGSQEPDGGLARDPMDQGASACLPPPKAHVPSHATRRGQDSTSTPKPVEQILVRSALSGTSGHPRQSGQTHGGH